MLTPTIKNVIPTTVGESPHQVEDEILIERIYGVLSRHLDTIAPVTSALHVDVEAGLVTVGGIVENESLRAQILADIQQVPGVGAVQDELSVGFDVEFQAIRALMTDPRTSGWATNITINAIADTVFLGGQVPTPAVARTVEAIVGAMPGVNEVCNHLRVVPDLDITHPLSSTVSN